MLEIPDWSLVQWVGTAAGLWAVGYGSGVARGWIRRIVSAS